jgi:hypothetical protein
METIAVSSDNYRKPTYALWTELLILKNWYIFFPLRGKLLRRFIVGNEVLFSGKINN